MSPARSPLRIPLSLVALLLTCLAGPAWAVPDTILDRLGIGSDDPARTLTLPDLKLQASRAGRTTAQSLRPGAPAADAGTTPRIDLVSPTPSWFFESDVANRALGTAVATAGDVNGDGYSDVVALGSTGVTNPRLYLFLGSDAGPELAAGHPLALPFTGALVAPAGDVNNDGHADLLVYWENGRLRVYFGSAAGFALGSYSEIAPGFLPLINIGINGGPAGDVNGDGYADIIVGLPNAGSIFPCSPSPSGGQAWVFFGGASGIATGSSWVLAGCYWTGPGSGLGSSVGTAGDVNADGFDDIVIGVPGDQLALVGTVGGAFVVYGSGAGLPLLPGFASVGTIVGATHVYGQALNGTFGFAVSTAGDVNGDGYADVAIGAPYDDTFAVDGGFAFVFRGSAAGLDTSRTNLLWSESSTFANTQFGRSLQPAGDVDGDGRADLLVGEAGRIDLVQSYGSTMLIEQFLPVYSGTSGPWLTGPAGDVNGDGISDLVFGDLAFSGPESFEGRVLVHYGQGQRPSPYPNWSSTQVVVDDAGYGWSVSSAGDVNGDGYDDVLIGSPLWDNWQVPGELDNGLLLLYLGGPTGPSDVASWYQFGAPGDILGVSVAAAGDVNGDGYADIIAGAHQSFLASGEARVWYGGPGGLLFGPPSVTLTGTSFNGLFGSSVAGAGDVNGDGFADVLVGAPWDETPSGSPLTDEGRAFVFLGGAGGLSTSPAWTGAGGQTGANFGSSVAGAGDVNGDGWSDIVVGAPYFDVPARPFTILDVAGFAEFHGGPGVTPLTFKSWHSYDVPAGGAVSVAHAGDVNRDGYSDVVMGAANGASTQPGEGYAAVHAGSPGGLGAAPLWNRYGGEAFGGFGSAVSSAGDANGDGLSDVLVGAVFQEAPSGQDAGHGYVFAGPLPAGAAPILTLSGPGPFANMGHALANAGDLNGDGWADLVFGEPGYSDAAYRQGLTQVYFGARGGAVFQLAFAIRTVPATRIVPPLGFTNPGSVLLGATGRSAAGRSRVRMQWKVDPVAGLPVPPQAGFTPWTQTGAPGARGSLTSLIPGVTNLRAGVPYSWRARVLSNSVYFPTGIWRSPARNGALEPDMRAPGVWLDAPVARVGMGELLLADVRPNPVRGAATVSFALTRAGDVKLEVLDLQGRRVRTLAQGSWAAGPHEARWDGRSEDGTRSATGIYFVRLQAEGRTLSRKVALLP